MKEITFAMGYEKVTSLHDGVIGVKISDGDKYLSAQVGHNKWHLISVTPHEKYLNRFFEKPVGTLTELVEQVEEEYENFKLYIFKDVSEAVKWCLDEK